MLYNHLLRATIETKDPSYRLRDTFECFIYISIYTLIVHSVVHFTNQKCDYGQQGLLWDLRIIQVALMIILSVYINKFYCLGVTKLLSNL